MLHQAGISQLKPRISIRKQLLATLAALLVSTCLFELTEIDIVVQDYFFNFQSMSWILDRDEKFTKLLFYTGIKKLFVIFIICILTALICLKNTRIVKQYKRGSIIVLLCCILVPVFIGFLKAVTNVPCPRDIDHYGGNYPYVTVLSQYPPTFHQETRIKCFPAAHASGGFALMSLFFLFIQPSNRRIALALAISAGWITGTYKMLIGDHFFSHTFTTMILAWLVILLIMQCVNNFDWFRINEANEPGQR